MPSGVKIPCYTLASAINAGHFRNLVLLLQAAADQDINFPDKACKLPHGGPIEFSIQNLAGLTMMLLPLDVSGEKCMTRIANIQPSGSSAYAVPTFDLSAIR